MEQTKEQREALQRYSQLLTAFEAAKEELASSAKELRKFDIYMHPPAAVRFPLRDALREGATHEIELGAPPKIFEGCITTGDYSDGSLGEIFLKAEKEGSFISGILDALAIVFSLSMQYGVPLEHIVDKLYASRFEPSGFTKNPKIPSAKSVIDYLMRWLDQKYLNEHLKEREKTDG